VGFLNSSLHHSARSLVIGDLGKLIDSIRYERTFFANKKAQAFAFQAVNKELISLYWDIGKSIVLKQKKNKWGSNVVSLLSIELQKDFAGIKGFSERNLWRMRNFYLTYKDHPKLTQLVAEIGWSHNNLILESCKDMLEREYYILMTKKFGWSRDILSNNIRNKSYQSFLTNQTNFENTLPSKQLHDASLSVKDEYSFDFLELSNEHAEKDLEIGASKEH